MLYLFTAFAKLRGVNPKDEAIYSGSEIVCDGNKKIPISWINDDYCDCQDGTDEKGTSACDTEFFCNNDGLSKYIPSSWVDDGRQDCCDGSDEQNGTNTCSELKLQLESKRKELSEKYRTGIEEKRSYIEFGLNWRSNSVKKISEDELKIQKLDQDLTALNTKIHELEKLEKFEDDVFQCNQFCIDNYNSRFGEIFESLKSVENPPQYVLDAISKYEGIIADPTPKSRNGEQNNGIISKILDWIPLIPRSSTGTFLLT
eukprot:NODE_130_length_16779_cov_1.687410.p9 type:complete len:258 gc:universal NODE_130_length_16779_cov_1.687410:3602-4375(+)